jgi:hypothetical protein
MNSERLRTVARSKRSRNRRLSAPSDGKDKPWPFAPACYRTGTPIHG